MSTYGPHTARLRDWLSGRGFSEVTPGDLYFDHEWIGYGYRVMWRAQGGGCIVGPDDPPPTLVTSHLEVQDLDRHLGDLASRAGEGGLSA